MKKSIASVLATLESIQSPPQVSEIKIGKQELHVVGDVVVRKNADGTFNLPVPPADIIRALASELIIDLNSDINTTSNSTMHKRATLLIQAVLTNQHDVVTILLNHGANPSIPDEDGNNAFIHASKRGDSATLKEFLTLIKTPDTKQPALAEANIEAEPAPTKDLGAYEKNQPMSASVAHTTAPSAEISERVSLPPDVLAHANKAGETAMKAIQLYKLSVPPMSVKALDAKQKNSFASPRLRRQKVEAKVEDTDLLTQMTMLVEELRVLNPPVKPVPQVKPSAEKTETQKVDNAYQEKLRRINHTYENFFNNKTVVHMRECRFIARIYSDIDQSAAREQKRIQALSAGPDNIPPMPTELIPTSMPVSFEDHAKVRAALALLKDYYAPESAPFSRSTKWHSLRRLFTFHTGRRYCEDAEKFYLELNVMPLATPKNIMEVYDAIDKKLEELRKLPHDKNGKNDIFNSSYTRRLFYIREKLKKTHAYDAAQTDLSQIGNQEAYLGVLDGINDRGGILGILRK